MAMPSAVTSSLHRNDPALFLSPPLRLVIAALLAEELRRNLEVSDPLFQHRGTTIGFDLIRRSTDPLRSKYERQCTAGHRFSPSATTPILRIPCRKDR